MNTNLERFKKELNELIKEGRTLYFSLAFELDNTSSEEQKKLKKLDLPDFNSNYEQWYSHAYIVIKQILPDRLDDFHKLYRNEKRKEVDFLTYTISDCLLGLVIRRSGEIICDGSAAVPKVIQQVNILESAEKKFESKLFDIINIVQADLFDSELDAANEILKKGFLRGAGAIGGVVLEKHLSVVCSNHKIIVKKKDPTISDLNDSLKKEDIIEIPTWRFIQHLGDLRNLCDHNKNREPKKEEVNELIQGVYKIIKTLF